MSKKYSDKMMKPEGQSSEEKSEDKASPAPRKDQEFYFPTKEVTIKAKSKEEALKKFEKIKK